MILPVAVLNLELIINEEIVTLYQFLVLCMQIHHSDLSFYTFVLLIFKQISLFDYNNLLMPASNDKCDKLFFSWFTQVKLLENII